LILDKKKFIEQLKVDGWSVKTDTGYKKVIMSNKTIPYEVYKIKTKNFNLKCADFHIVFDKDYNEKKIIDLNIGDEIITENGPEKIISIEKMDYVENMYDLTIDDENHRYYTNGILSHNTTISAFYLLYEACFPIAKGDLLIVAHRQSHSMEVLKRLKEMYYSMPLWLKPGVVKNNETSLVFDNGMRIIAEATTANAARGKSLKIVYCVDGKTKISIRNKKTGEIREIDIEDLYLKDEYK
jgi:hypothetical protein